MKKSAVVVGVIYFVISISVVEPGVQGTPGQTDREKALESLIEAERSFSRTSEEKGIREAFLTWLRWNAVVFRPGPVEGRPVYEKMDPANPAVLTWEPEVADVAASGEFGYTSGPYRMSPQRGAEPTRFGHYVSVWKKQPDGAWKVFLDIGVQHDPPASLSPIEKIATRLAEGDFKELSLEAHRDEGKVVAERARQFASAVASRGYRSALAEFATDDIRVYRPGRFPVVGKSLIKELIPKSIGRHSLSRFSRTGTSQVSKSNFRAEIAWTGDLAVTFGTLDQLNARRVTEKAAFLKIWRKGRPADAWEICLDLEIPVPAETEKTG
jgi:ketosteroid isomerase-like protein